MTRRVARVAGIPIVIDPSWLIVAVLVVWVLFAELAAADNGTGLAADLAVAVAGALVFFGCLLVHELSHSLVAVRRGLTVRRVRLFVFGGVSEIEQEAGTPQDELLITVAGPAASAGLALLFLLAAVVVPAGAGAVDDVLELLAVVNLALAVFNLLPGFPLDGGRVVRAVVWRITGSFSRATVVAVAGGRLIAVLMAAAGVALVTLAVDPAGLWWVAIGWFLWVAAGRSLRQLRIEEKLEGVPVSAVMAAPAAAVGPGAALAALAANGASVAPVVVGGRVYGLVDLDHVRRLRPAERAGWTAGDVMVSVRPGDVVAADDDALGALARLGEGRPLVVVAGDRMVGVLRSVEVDGWLRAATRR